MSKIEKKKEKLQSRIEQLEFELKNSLQKKAAGPAINIAKYMQDINVLKKELNSLV